MFNRLLVMAALASTPALAASPCLDAANLLAKGVLKSATTVEKKAVLVAKPEFGGINAENFGAMYRFDIDVNKSCVISYSALFELEMCVIEELKVTEFCG